MTKFCPICCRQYPDNEVVCPSDRMPLFDLDDPHIDSLIDGRFKVIEKIGEGGMSKVYKAISVPTGEICALKILAVNLAADQKHRERFFRESLVATRIDHEKIIRVREIGETEERVIFMVMEYLAGPTLSKTLAEGTMPVDRAIRIGRQIASGLAHAHSLGVVHRDIKPENVMFILPKGVTDHIKLLDFGLALMKGAEKLTATGQVFGTPEYISPEQATGRAMTPQSDLYSLGVVLYEMVSGKRPFNGSVASILRSHVDREPDPPSKANPLLRLPEEIDRVVLKLLRKEPEERYRDAHQLFDDLTELEKALSPKDGGREEQKDDVERESYDFMILRKEIYPSRTVSMVDLMLTRWNNIEEISCRNPLKNPPDWLGQCLAQLALLVEEAKSVVHNIKNESSIHVKRELGLIDKRERLGSAVDVVAGDESRLKRMIEISKKKLSAIEGQISSARSRRQKPLPELERRYKETNIEIQQNISQLSDLGSQLGELRGRLGELSLGPEYEAQDKRNLMLTRTEELRAIMKKFEPLAERVEPLFKISHTA